MYAERSPCCVPILRRFLMTSDDGDRTGQDGRAEDAVRAALETRARSVSSYGLEGVIIRRTARRRSTARVAGVAAAVALLCGGVVGAVGLYNHPAPQAAADPPGPNPRCPKSCSDQAQLSIQDGQWRLDRIRVVSNKRGVFEATAEVTYTGHRRGCGCTFFTIDILDDRVLVTTVSGQPFLPRENHQPVSADPGETVTVQLTDENSPRQPYHVFPAGPYTYRFNAAKVGAG